MTGIQRYGIRLTLHAKQDLRSIHDYIAEFDSFERAGYVVDKVLEAIDRLETFPERGEHPPELSGRGIMDFRQTRFKAYRIVYEIDGDQVIVHLIADGRRNMQALLRRRLLIAAPPTKGGG